MENVLHRIYELSVVFLFRIEISFVRSPLIRQSNVRKYRKHSITITSNNKLLLFYQGRIQTIKKGVVGTLSQLLLFCQSLPIALLQFYLPSPSSLLPYWPRREKIKRVCLFCIKACLSYFLTPHPSHERNSRGAFCV